jgi:hypothetical protein
MVFHLQKILPARHLASVANSWQKFRPVRRKIRPLRKNSGPLLFLTFEGVWAEEKKSLQIRNNQCNLLQDVVNNYFV